MNGIRTLRAADAAREVALQELVTQETLEVPKAERHGQTETATCGDGDSLTRRVGTGTAFMNSTTRKGNKLRTSRRTKRRTVHA